ncbi:ABC transporter permease [Ensifer sp. Root31]|uniref:ABC transporter permease n=1 Tax=Ensifer sp. Root31 TaxID=1736512 RepID=UPI000708F890|nr:ABC transporter permease subunit [Ensifer sp. Root31]KQU74661.1 ABC transporter permease [Ensifer sp. Root31]
MADGQFSIGQYFAAAIDWMNRNWSGGFHAFSDTVDAAVHGLETALLAVPPFVLVALVAWGSWRVSGRGLSLFTAAGLAFCWFGNLWAATMLTTALVIISVILALVIAIPLGIIAASNPTAERILRPVLDLMQTLPPWVYLIPAVILLGVGRAPAVLATVIFGIPPALRLTVLGLKQVQRERIELGQAFGASSLQILTRIKLPSALPSIMLGVNQTILVSLGMVVLAGLIGAGGLGGEVTRGLSRMMLGLALRAGIAVVILSIILDRLTQGLVRKEKA